MILYQNDWRYYPGAIVNLDTENKTWVRYAALLDRMGVRNNVFHLALLDKDLVGVDPHDPDLDEEMEIKILREIKNNPWYTLREVVKVPSTGSASNDPFGLSRLNAAFFWCSFQNVNTFVMGTRQSGKSFGAEVLEVILNDIYGRRLPMDVIVNSSKLRSSTTAKKVAVRRLIPQRFSFRNDYGVNKDKENIDFIDCKALGNVIRTMQASDKVELAKQLGRGLTSPIRHGDEIAHCQNINISMGIAEMGGMQAIEKAKENGTPYFTTYTTTPGDLSTEQGRYAYNIQSKAMRWNEKCFDCVNVKDFLNTITKQTGGASRWVNITMHYHHLGRDDLWLASEIIRTEATPEDVQKDMLLIWGSGGADSPLDKVTLERISNSRKEPTKTTIDKMHYMASWYLDDHSTIEEYVRTHPCILSIDPSELAGSDANGVTLVDIKNMKPIMTAKPCDGNLYNFAVWIYELLSKYPSVPLIIERKSTGVSLIDTLIALFVKDNKNPLKRIIGRWHLDENLIARYGRALYADTADLTMEEYSLFKTHIGISTNGQIRRELYERIFMDLTLSYGHNIFDESIIKQMTELVKRNGRIDHPVKGNDDLVIAWLMVGYVLLNFTNLRYYGIDIRDALQEGWRDPKVESNSNLKPLTKEEREYELYLVQANKEQFDALMGLYLTTTDVYELRIIEKQLTATFKKIAGGNNTSTSLSTIMADIEAMKEEFKQIQSANKRQFLTSLFT